MLVSDIEITHYQYCRKSARHMANVRVTLQNQIVTLFCQLASPEGQGSQARAKAFVSEATRQLRRMPEFRSGRNTLEFPDDLTGAPSARSA